MNDTLLKQKLTIDEITKQLSPNQKNIIRLLNSKEHKVGVINSSVRSGKTLAMLYWLKRHYDNGNFPDNAILWICHDSDELNTHLLAECKKWGFMDLYAAMTRTLPQSLHHYIDNHYNVIVYNECQSITERYASYLMNYISYDRLWGLTGTYPDKPLKRKLLEDLGLIELYKYSTEDAVEDNNVANYNITIVEIPLNTEKNILVTYTADKKTNTVKSFYTSEASSYDSLSKKIINEVNPKSLKFHRLNRMRLLNSAKSKITATKQILLKKVRKQSDSKYLIFSQDSNAAEEIGKYIFHSQTDDKYKKAFDDDQIPYLILVEKASTGTTYKNLTGCIFTAINSSSVNIHQKAGRSLLYRDDYIADIIILVSKNTVQIKWVQSALKNFNQEKIRTIDYEDYLKELDEK